MVDEVSKLGAGDNQASKIASFIEDGERAAADGRWDIAAELFWNCVNFSALPHHAIRYVNALLKSGQTEVALQACEELPAFLGEGLNARCQALKLQTYVSSGQLGDAQAYLATLEPGGLSAQTVLRLVAACRQEGATVDWDVAQSHVNASGDPDQKALLAAYRTEDSGDTEGALDQYRRIEAQGTEPGVTIAQLQIARIAQQSEKTLQTYVSSGQLGDAQAYLATLEPGGLSAQTVLRLVAACRQEGAAVDWDVAQSHVNASGDPDQKALLAAYRTEDSGDTEGALDQYRRIEAQGTEPGATIAQLQIARIAQQSEKTLQTYVSSGQLGDAQAYLATLEPGGLSAQTVLRLVAACRQEGATVDWDVAQSHVNASGDPDQKALLAAYRTEDSGDTEGALDQYRRIEAQGTEPGATIAQLQIARIAQQSEKTLQTYVSSGQLGDAQAYLATLEPGGLSAQTVLRLVAACRQEGATVDWDVAQSHVNASGDPDQKALLAAYRTEDSGDTEGALDQYRRIEAQGTEPGATIAQLQIARIAQQSEKTLQTYVSSGQLGDAQAYLATLEPGGLSAQTVLRLVAACRQEGAAVDWDVAQSHVNASGDPDQKALLAAYRTEDSGDTEGALDQYRRIEAQGTEPGATIAQLQIARIAQQSEKTLQTYVSSGQLGDAQAYLATLEPGGLSAQTVLRLVAACRQEGAAVDWDVAQSHVNASGDPDQKALLAAYRTEDSGDTEGALDQYRRIEAQGTEPGATIAQLQIARISARLGDRAAAGTAWTRVLENHAGHIEALNFLINDALQQGQTERALEMLNASGDALDLPDAFIFKAKILGDVPQAVDLLEHAVDAMPDNVDVRIALVNTLMRQNDVEGSKQALARGLDQDPKNLALNQAYFALLEHIGAPLEEQLAQARTTLNLRPSDQDAQLSVGLLLTKLDRRAEALSHYQEVLKSEAAPTRAWKKAAELLIEESRLDEAAALAARAKKQIGADTPQQLVDTASVYAAIRRHEDAIVLVRDALSQLPGFPDALKLAADIEFSRGRDHAALEYLNTYDSLEPAKRRSTLADAMARCAAAGTFPNGPGKPDDPHNLFPERMFHHIAKTARADYDPSRKGILHVGATLAAGGAERQLSYLLSALQRSEDLERRPQLIIRNIDRSKRNDFYLDDVIASGTELNVVTDFVKAGKARQQLSHRVDLGKIVRGFAASPAELSDVLIPLFAHFIETKPRVVHLWQDSICATGSLAAMAAGVPAIVLSFRSTTPVEVSRSRRYLRQSFLACTHYDGVLKVINNSSAGAHDYEEWLGFEPGRIGVIHNGYDFDRISSRATSADPRQLRAEHGIPDNALLVGTVMRFAPEKRPELWIDTVAEAAKHDERVYGVMVGEGPKWQSLAEQVKHRGLDSRIKLVGRQSPVEPWLTAMDLFFLSSAREGLPNVLIEAQSLGVPVAAMDVGGATETLMDQDTGIVLPEEGPEVLAKHLLDALRDPEWRKAVGQRSREFVRSTFSLDAAGRSVMKLYDEIETELESNRFDRSYDAG